VFPQLFHYYEQHYEKGLAKFLKPNLKNLIQLFILKTGCLQKNAIDEASKQRNHIVLKWYFLKVVLAACFAEPMPVTQLDLLFNHNDVLQMNSPMDNLMLLQGSNAFEKRKKRIDNLLLRKLAIRVAALPQFNFFEQGGLLLGVEDSLVKCDAAE